MSSSNLDLKQELKLYSYFIIKPTRYTNFTNLFWHETLHVSDSSSVHHREFIHCTLSNGISHTGL
jgi:UDP-N-acetylglucosamine 2-epimerase